MQRLGRDAVGHPELLVVLGRDKARHAAAEHEAIDDARVRVALHQDAIAGLGERQAEGVVPLRGAVGQKPRAAGPVGGRGQLLGALVGRWGGAEVDPLDVLADIERQRPIADRGAEARVGARAALVARDVEANRAAEAVGDDRLQIRCRRQLAGGRGRGCALILGDAHRAAFSR